MMKIGILGTSDIAFGRFLPALKKVVEFEFIGVASREVIKTKKFTEAFGGVGYVSYEALLSDSNVDAVYIPLPPALHYEWARQALLNGKHVMLEKPFTTELNQAQELTKLAQSKNLALHENYMFVFHSQLDFIKNKLTEIGEVRLIRADFGFPFRGANDFRYDKNLGGGALLDCGGYTLKLATMLLGEVSRITSVDYDIQIVDAALSTKDGFDVDIYGSSVLRSGNTTAQIAFGMDNSYRCFLDIWGSAGSISTDRIFTAPDGYEPIVKVNGDEFKLLSDDSFAKSIAFFATLPKDYTSILQQAELIEQFKLKAY